MPIIEQHGLIDAFTLAVFRQAVAQQRAWLRQGHAIKLNVNLSMDNLLRVDLPEVLAGIVSEAGLEADNIVLEMTESRLMSNLRLSLDILIRLRLKGFGLSIDDFGTGYSTMENLKQLPFTELKVDRVFVHGADSDPAARAILDSSLRLGRSFGLNLVAEGVETRQDWDLIVASGCDEIQGYYVARPMPAAALLDWKDNWEGNMERNAEMNNKATILIVDDDSTIRELFDAMLGDSYRIVTATNGEEALAAASAEKPEVILLDVEMRPGIDGYETCRRLKQDETTAAIPVIFVSARDCIEDRLKGYEAGGEDYITKPFDAQELEAKVAQRIKAVAERNDLKQMAEYASTTAMTAMTSMSEMGALLEAMKRFSSCSQYRELADAVLIGLAPYGLRGVVQIRSPEGTLTRTQQGEASPLEVSVIGHMATMERIVQFKSRLSITYRHVTLLVQDMPTDDPDRCGRLRDHLAMLAEGAEARAEAIAAGAEAARRGATIERAVTRITAALVDIDRTQRESQIAVRLSVDEVTQRMEEAFVSVAMSTNQEDYMAGILKDGLAPLLNAQTGVSDLQNKLTTIVRELQEMAA
jgi:EAL domain-containing protein (putative c-di-GMP-specific phosphodiesterase class I)/CheY-like chemotaxis protein